MNKTQRTVAILYCLLIVYCCVWVPWHYVDSYGTHFRAGYAWLWRGPKGGFGQPIGSPDFPIIGLELLGVTALAGAAFAATQC